MTTYYVTLLFCVVLAYAAEKRDFAHENRLTADRVAHSRATRNLFIVLSLILIVVAGFRYGVGADYWGYYRAGERYSNEFLDRLKTLRDPGIRAVYIVVRLFSKENIASMFVVAAITISLMLGVIYKHTDKLLMAVTLFLFLGCWHESFNAVRQCLAAAIVFSGYDFLKNKKLFKYSLVILLALLFHRSAILMILPYFIVRIKVSPKNILLVIIGVFMALYGFDRIMALTGFIMQETEELSTEYATRSVSILRVAVAIAPAAFYLFVSRGHPRDDSHNFYLNLLIVHAVVVAVTSPSAMLGRYGIYTAPFCTLAIPELNKLESAKLRFGHGRTLSIGFIMCLLFFAYWIYAISNDFTMNPYHWYWNYRQLHN